MERCQVYLLIYIYTKTLKLLYKNMLRHISKKIY